MANEARQSTTKLLDLVDEGILDPLAVLRECLCYMSEADVANMCQNADYFYDDMEDEDEGIEDEDELEFDELPGLLGEEQ